MDIWGWIEQCRAQYQEAADEARLEMVACLQRAYDFNQKDPDLYLSHLNEGRRLARQLSEPLWILYFDAKYLEGLIDEKKDYRQALDLAVHCAVEVHKAAYEYWPGRHTILDIVLFTYVRIDPWGYEEEIRRFMAHLNELAPRESHPTRHGLMHSRRKFAIEREAWSEALEVASAHLELIDAAADRHRLTYDRSTLHTEFCLILYQLGRWEDMGEHACLAEDLTRQMNNTLDLAEALVWQAVLAQHGGHEKKALRMFRAASERIAGCKATPYRECYQALVAFHEEGGRWEKALQVRDEELETCRGTGQWAYECRLHIERCRLLKKLGRLSAADAEAARLSLTPLRRPERYREKLESVVAV